jgi:pyruvate/2-oxoglutarate dehydrogenase complex dihydrolipoamide dehydrogenase (E3) component
VIYDIAVIGAGSGGLSVAAAAAHFGRKVVLFEKGKMGGDCLNYGCVPSKSLIAAAKHAHAMRTSTKYGIAAVEPKVDFKKVQSYVQSVITTIEPIDSVERFEKLGVNVVQAVAKFRDAKTLEAGGNIYTAKRIVIATGSRASVPPIPGLANVPYLTNETIFENKVLPKHLIIIGGGPIGMELGQAHRRLGSDVTIIQASNALAKDDPELAAVVIGALRGEGVRILEHTEITKVTKSTTGFAVDTAQHGTIKGSHLLVAAGRTPNVEDLNLEAAGVTYAKQGVTVDAGLRTTQKHIYAIGDVAGGLQFTHVAGYHAGLVIRNALFRLPVKNRTDIIPWVTYTSPELAHIGMSEARAREEFGDGIKVIRWPFHDNDRAQTEGVTSGLVKAVVGKRGKILGVSIVSESAGELIQTWVLAVSQELKISSVAGMVAPYPTRGEASRRVGVNYYAGLATNAYVRKLIQLLGYFG